MGKYDVYYGQDAFDYLAASEAYAAGAEALEQVLLEDMNGYQLRSSYPAGILDSMPLCCDTAQ